MASIGSVQSGASGALASALRAADQNTEVAAALLKKATDADKNLANTLLPANGGTAGRVNIGA